MKSGTIVQTSSGRVGVVCDDFMGCCTEEETPVVFDGDDAFDGQLTSSLTAIGKYDVKAADLWKCGANQGEKACRYAVVGPEGAECARFSNLRNHLIMSRQVAKFAPKHLAPNCYPFPDATGKATE